MSLLKKTRTMTGQPVFYDPSGKRLRHMMVSGVLLMSMAVGFSAWIIPKASAPVKDSPYNQASGFPRRFLATPQPEAIPVLGESVSAIFTRIASVRHDNDTVSLIDPYTNQPYREATADEVKEIGKSPYVYDYFGRPADRQLMLTFDDGPDPIYTRQILDILADEHVPATFFLIGSSMVKSPEIVRRITREGHMVGNHTMSHLKFDTQTDRRNREELIGTERIIRAISNYETKLFRIPEGDPDRNALALLQSQQFGYLHINMDVDTLDWDYAPGEDIPVPRLDGKGHVVLLHDGGGDRSATVAMLRRFIRSAKDQGYSFATLEPMLPPEYIPAKNITPSLADHATYHTFQAFWVLPAKVFTVLFWFGAGSLTIMSLLYVILATINCRRRTKEKDGRPTRPFPFVSVVMAAYNEDKVIARTLTTLRQSDYPSELMEVIVVNDGSSDGTRRILDECASGWNQLRVYHQSNSGKSAAINNAMSRADPRARILVTLDADTIFDPQTIKLLVRRYMQTTHRKGSKPVGAVAGHVKVGNRRNILTAWQSLEYISGICITRMAEGLVGAIAIVPGACSAWNREALEKIGGFSEDTLAEDADATLQLHRHGYQVLQEHRAIAYTEAPETVRDLAKQRLRWVYGNIQALWKHKGMILSPRYGVLGMITLPYILLSLLIPLVFLPPTVFIAVRSLLEGNWKNIVLFATFVFAIHLVISTVAIIIARESPWHLLIIPVYRLIYEPLRAYLLYASLIRILRGTAAGWNKVERSGSVNAHSATMKAIPS